MAATKVVLLILVVALFTPGSTGPNAVQKREALEDEAINAREEQVLLVYNYYNCKILRYKQICLYNI